MLLRTLVAVAAAFSLTAGPAPGSGATGLATPVADGYVSAVMPTRNFGAASTLTVSAKPLSVAVLRFRVALPPGETVTRATLELFASATSAKGFAVHAVTSTTWSERTVDYANVPAIATRPVAASGAYRGRRYVSVDVTPLVTRGGLVSLAVKARSAVPLAFNSREAATGRPRLVIETARTAAGGAGRPCGTAAAPPRGVEHVIWIWMENKTYGDVVGSPAAPFVNRLAAACGLATNYHGVSHPSLPNYIAATSGSTQGIADDEPPSAHPLDVASIYSQLDAAGKTWRDYAESAPGPCALTSSGLYTVRHDPAAYYTGIRSECPARDVPMGGISGGTFAGDLESGTLPAFSFVTPDLCNDTHDCPVSTGDSWLRSWLSKILSSPAYRGGRTVVFVVWDEDDGLAQNRVPLVVVSPSTPAGTQASAFFDHYALLKTTEQLLGLPTTLGHAAAAGTPSMAPAFGLG